MSNNTLDLFPPHFCMTERMLQLCLSFSYLEYVYYLNVLVVGVFTLQGTYYYKFFLSSTQSHVLVMYLNACCIHGCVHQQYWKRMKIVIALLNMKSELQHKIVSRYELHIIPHDVFICMYSWTKMHTRHIIIYA